MFVWDIILTVELSNAEICNTTAMVTSSATNVYIRNQVALLIVNPLIASVILECRNLSS